MRAWACERCDELHTQNPSECRNCGHGVFRPISESELRQRSSPSDGPDSFTPEHTVGSLPEEEVEKSPDVNPDGSIKRPDDADGEQDDAGDAGLLARIRAWLPV